MTFLGDCLKGPLRDISEGQRSPRKLDISKKELLKLRPGHPHVPKVKQVGKTISQAERISLEFKKTERIYGLWKKQWAIQEDYWDIVRL